MIITVTTTVTLDDRLITQRNRRAADSGASVGRGGEEGHTEPAQRIAFGAGGRFSRHHLDKASTLLDVDDVERHAGHE